MYLEPYGLGRQGLVALSIIALLPLAGAAQGTSAASVSGVVTDSSGGIVPGVAVEVSSPVLIEKVRATTTNERGEYRVVELRPGTYTVTFTRQGFASFRREGIELTSNFNATVHAELRVGGFEQSVTVSGASPLVDAQNVARRTVISKALLDTVPTRQEPPQFLFADPSRGDADKCPGRRRQQGRDDGSRFDPWIETGRHQDDDRWHVVQLVRGRGQSALVLCECADRSRGHRRCALRQHVGRVHQQRGRREPDPERRRQPLRRDDLRDGIESQVAG